MHLLKYNPDAKTLTEVPPSEFDPHPLTPCRYFYVLGKRAHVPIVTPDGIGEIVWQHPDYQPPSPANTMTDQHRATPEQWEELQTVSQSILKMHAPHSCILELRDRVEALEATQHAHIEAKAAGAQVGRSSAAVDRVLALQDQIRDGESGVRYAMQQAWELAAEQLPQDKLGRLIEQDRSDPRQLILVERVADAIGAADDEGLTNMTWSYHSRAAIRAVAEWLRSEYPQREGCGTAWANLIDNEANR
jgi:hypothetical protein